MRNWRVWTGFIWLNITGREQAVVNTVKNIFVHIKDDKFLVTLSFSRALLQGFTCSVSVFRTMQKWNVHIYGLNHSGSVPILNKIDINTGLSALPGTVNLSKCRAKSCGDQTTEPVSNSWSLLQPHRLLSPVRCSSINIAIFRPLIHTSTSNKHVFIKINHM